MLKRLVLALAFAAGLASPAFAAGTVPGFSLQRMVDNTGAPLINCKLYVIQAGTTSTPQNAYQDSGLTIPLPNPLSCDGNGWLPQFFVADGSIKLRLTDSNGNQQLVADNILVIGPSGGSGSGSSVDPTTILATGDFKMAYGTGTLAGFVRCNGRTIGSATSGATERANSDTQALFEFLWNADHNLAVAGGRGASASADWSANKTITLPDCRGRALAGLDDMGNTAAGRLTSTYFGTGATTLGAAGGSQSFALATANLPPYTPSGTINNSLQLNTNANGVVISGGGGSSPFSASVGSAYSVSSISLLGAVSFSGTAQGGTDTPLATITPEILMTIYIKL